ncbi:hypothetical protein MLD38_023604 [Melastoma candidum]|uniref:Uncharacterized protein n=1 Tax=Melastoma candidum TaxID=119954 RepID=A0ACB9NPX2_9MYRT|nr:hypothetical protein MLD38_023604 [Melastoma candidum]
MCPSGVQVQCQEPSNAGLRPAFEILDADHDGKISRDDLCSFYSGFSRDGITDEDAIGTMMSAADSDSDGYVEYEEFERAVERPRMRRPRRGGVMEDVFKIMDGDRDGKLSREDIKGFMRSSGINAGDEEVEAMFVLGGGEKEGGVTYEVFVKILGVDDLC